jgi:hypothetical protein
MKGEQGIAILPSPVNINKEIVIIVNINNKIIIDFIFIILFNGAKLNLFFINLIVYIFCFFN